MTQRFLKLFAAAGMMALMVGCAAPTKNFDYAAFKASKPRSIVVLPPLNKSLEVGANYGLLSQVTVPLAEAGYYVLPVTLVNETFQQNGLTVASDIHDVPVAKLRDIFNADTALYITITQYGTKYMVLDSISTVAAVASLVDLKSGQTLWTGQARASSNEGNNNSGGSLVGMLMTAVVKQIIHSSTDHSYDIAGTTSFRLLSAGQPAGILYGPRSPKYGTD
ncbi:DUF799 domain-containing protein [Mycoavidus sp. B2-EB]|uniref:DUF799 domain-containing protein n=1 Tax=Mycoavidus sp. B2-EB TaxID=2651972 RepID=UPI00162660B2|nr:DUF799 domain-containing protein [Mycoavidus sp. B2-EB]BBO59733.1 lipoprotein [Mycoavidus sp. B2-EB]